MARGKGKEERRQEIESKLHHRAFMSNFARLCFLQLRAPAAPLGASPPSSRRRPQEPAKAGAVQSAGRARGSTAAARPACSARHREPATFPRPLAMNLRLRGAAHKLRGT